MKKKQYNLQFIEFYEQKKLLRFAKHPQYNIKIVKKRTTIAETHSKLKVYKAVCLVNK